MWLNLSCVSCLHWPQSSVLPDSISVLHQSIYFSWSARVTITNKIRDAQPEQGIFTTMTAWIEMITFTFPGYSLSTQPAVSFAVKKYAFHLSATLCVVRLPSDSHHHLFPSEIAPVSNYIITRVKPAIKVPPPFPSCHTFSRGGFPLDCGIFPRMPFWQMVNSVNQLMVSWCDTSGVRFCVARYYFVQYCSLSPYGSLHVRNGGHIDVQ